MEDTKARRTHALLRRRPFRCGHDDHSATALTGCGDPRDEQRGLDTAATEGGQCRRAAEQADVSLDMHRRCAGDLTVDACEPARRAADAESITEDLPQDIARELRVRRSVGWNGEASDRSLEPGGLGLRRDQLGGNAWRSLESGDARIEHAHGLPLDLVMARFFERRRELRIDGVGEFDGNLHAGPERVDFRNGSRRIHSPAQSEPENLVDRPPGSDVRGGAVVDVLDESTWYVAALSRNVHSRTEERNLGRFDVKDFVMACAH